MAKIACPMLVLLTVVLLTVVAQPVQAQQQTPEALAARVAGCYTLDIGPWPEALDRDYPSAMRLRLDTMRFTARRMLPDSASAEERHEATESYDLNGAFMVYRSFEREWKNWQAWRDWKNSGEGVAFLPERLWRMEARDSLSIQVTPMPGSFLHWHFRREGELLRGRVTFINDTGLSEKPSPSAPVTAHPVPCSSD